MIILNLMVILFKGWMLFNSIWDFGLVCMMVDKRLFNCDVFFCYNLIDSFSWCWGKIRINDERLGER